MEKEKETAIYNVGKLSEDIKYYAEMFPNNHFTLQEIVDTIIREALSQSDFSEFGFSVSDEWKEKCYCFHILENSSDILKIKYTGIRKV
jgi:hypothetical protein